MAGSPGLWAQQRTGLGRPWEGACLSGCLPPSDPGTPTNPGPCTYHSSYLEPPPDPHTAHPSLSQACAPTANLKEA